MKKFIIALVALMSTMFTSANAMSYEQAREQALFLTDKMAYELNLNEMQYEAAYEINLDYLLSINTYDDLYSSYWVHRNTDFRHILFDWQYNAYIAASYFYRPLWWDAGCWHFGIYARYPHRTYFYFGRPVFYTTYHGGHSWHMNGGRSWYSGRNYGTNNHGSFRGMRDGWNRGDYRGGHENVRNVRSSASSSSTHSGRIDNHSSRNDSQVRRNDSQVRGNREQGTMHSNINGGRRSNESMRDGNRESSTRTTVNRTNNNDTYNVGRRSSEGFTPSRSTSTTTTRSTSMPSRSTSTSSMSSRSGSFSGSRGGSNFSGGSRGGSSFSGGSHGGGSHGGGSHGGGFSGRR